MAKLQNVTDAEFEQEVLKADKPVLVDFWAAWCGPCRTLGPILEEIGAARESDLKVVKVNVDENVQYAAKLGIMSLPTMVLFNGGAPVDKMVGAYPKRGIEQWLDESLTAVK